MTQPGEAPKERGEVPLEITPDMLAGNESMKAPPPATGGDGREDFEAGISYLPPITLAFIVLNVGMFIWQLKVGALENEYTIVAFGALRRAEVMEGQWWRLLSASVLHGGVEHVVSNVVALYVIGIGLEHAIGGPRTALMYLLTAIGASLASVMTNEGPGVGASGAVFGLMGALIVFLWRWRHRYEVRDKRVAGVMAAWAGYTVLVGMGIPYIDNAAHVGGLVSGATIGTMLTPLKPAPRPRPSSARIRIR